jgi:hypothetical protein
VAVVRAGDLDIDVDMAFQRRAWLVQRVAWAVMALLVAAALGGLLGPGPLTRATAGEPGALEAEYQRLTRYEDAEVLTLRLAPAVTAPGVVRVSVNREYLDHARVESVMPAPERTEAAEGRVVFAFRVAEPGRPLDVSFTLKPRRIGPTEARLRVESPGAPGREVRFRQFAYP